MSAATILDRADRPKPTRPGCWMFGCPICQSRKGRPVSLRELDDGRILLHAFCGHETADVLAALGLSLADLYPSGPLRGNGPAGGFSPSRSRIPARDLLELISEEVGVVAVIAADLVARKTVSEPDWTRLAQAATRIGKARDHVAPLTINPRNTVFPNYGR